MAGKPLGTIRFSSSLNTATKKPKPPLKPRKERLDYVKRNREMDRTNIMARRIVDGRGSLPGRCQETDSYIRISEPGSQRMSQ
jgi:hypothetical protein